MIQEQSVASRRLEPLYEVRKSGIHGRGVFAARRIRKGTSIVRYVGELITHDEANDRYDDSSMKRHHTFLFTVDRWHVIDGAPDRGGGDASFINHSCDPNCQAVIDGKKIFIQALRTIEPGEELAYDYRYDRAGKESKEDEAFYVCRCGSEKCRGTILAPKKKKRRKVKR